MNHFLFILTIFSLFFFHIFSIDYKYRFLNPLGGIHLESPNLDSNFLTSFSSLAYPESRSHQATFFDTSSGYIFGGTSHFGSYYLGDLWEFSFSLKKWRWIDTAGGNIQKQRGFKGNYGPSGVYSTMYYPGARKKMGYYGTSSYLYIYGGSGSGTYNGQITLADLWQYRKSTKEWRFLGNTSTIGSGVYAVFEGSNSDRFPGARWGSVLQYYTQKVGKFVFGYLWLFGGSGYTASSSVGEVIGDNWRYSIFNGAWYYIGNEIQKGHNFKGVYSTKYSTRNYPGARNSAISFQSTGCIYIFGGWGISHYSTYTYKYVPAALGDLWVYNYTNGGLWKYLSQTDDDEIQKNEYFPGTYKNAEYFKLGNHPGTRFFAAGQNVFKNGIWYVFGGYGHRTKDVKGYLGDLWEYSVQLNRWKFTRTVRFYNLLLQDEFNILSSFGEEYDHFNFPSSREGASMWTYGNSIYIFGGVLTVKKEFHWSDVWELGHPSSPKEYYECNNRIEYNNDVCSSHGRCDTGTCYCYEGYTSDDCEIPICYNRPANDQTSCSNGNGLCVQPDYCQCDYLTPKCDGYEITTNYPLFYWKFVNNTGERERVEMFLPIYGENFKHLYTPGSRTGSAIFTYEDSVFLFGGEIDGNYRKGDIWEFRNDDWRWINTIGDSTQQGVDFTGVYGYFYHPFYFPGARSGASFIKHDNDFYLFGGHGFSQGSFGYLGDVWTFNYGSGLWKTVSKISTQRNANFVGNYGTFYETFYPGSRAYYSSFSYGSSIFICFGYGYSESTIGFLGDMWEYSIKLGKWRWINTNSGTDIQKGVNFQGVNGEFFDPSFYPESRYMAASFQYGDSFYLFGGEFPMGTTLGDLWEFNIIHSKWRLLNSINEGNPTQKGVDFNGVYGEEFENGIYPSSRKGIGYFQYSTSFFIYGGFGGKYTTRGFIGDLYEFNVIKKEWRFINTVPDSTVTKGRDFYGNIGEELTGEFYPRSRSNPSLVRLGKIVYMFGGIGYTTSGANYHYLGDMWSLSLAGHNFKPTRCFGLDFDDVSVCNGHGVCVLDNYCQCNEVYIGLNCGIYYQDNYLENNKEYTLIFYPFSSNVEEKCLKENEMYDICLGGTDQPIIQNLNNLNGIISEPFHQFELVRGVSVFGEILMYNHKLKMNEVIISNGIDLFKSVDHCEQFTTSQAFDIKVLSGCRTCFGVSYYDTMNVCSGHGTCESYNFCDCYSGYYGGRCEYSYQNMSLTDDKKYTLIFYDYSPVIEDKCSEIVYLFRVCLGDPNIWFYNEIQNINIMLMLEGINQPGYIFELYSGLSVFGTEVVKYNNIADTSDVVFSNSIDFYTVNKCQSFNTSSLIEMKIANGCTSCNNIPHYDMNVCNSRGDCLSHDFCDCWDGIKSFGGYCEFFENETRLYQGKEYTLVFYHYTSTLNEKCTPKNEYFRVCLGGNDTINNTMQHISDRISALTGSTEYQFQIYKSPTEGEYFQFNNINVMHFMKFSNKIYPSKNKNNCEEFDTIYQGFEMKIIEKCTSCFGYTYYDVPNVCNGKGECLANNYCSCEKDYIGGGCKINITDYSLIADNQYTLTFHNFASDIADKCKKDLEFMRICVGGQEFNINQTMEIINKQLQQQASDVNSVFEIYRDLSSYGEIVMYNNVVNVTIDNIVFSNEVDLFRSNMNCEKFSTSEKFEMKVIPGCLSCFNYKYYENSVCSSHGQCLKSDFCICEEGYFGGNCEFMSNKTKLHLGKEFTLIFYEYENAIEDKCKKEIQRFCFGGNEKIFNTLNNITSIMNNKTTGYEFEIYYSNTGEMIRYNDIRDIESIVFSNTIDLFTSNDECESFTTSDKFEMKVLPDCTQCFDIPYYFPNVCSGRGKCLSEDFCKCDASYFGGNCEFSSGERYLMGGKSYTLIFYDYSHVVEEKCSNEFEFARKCLGGEGVGEDLRMTFLSINQILKSHVGEPIGSFKFEIYRGSTHFGEIIKYNNVFEKNNMEFSSPIVISKSINNCEQFSTTEKFEIKIVDGCRSCYGHSYYESEVCSKHGNCLSEDYCVCEEGYFGGNCEFLNSLTGLYQNNEYTLVFYNYSSIVENKCSEELFRFCLGGDKHELINNTIDKITMKLLNLHDANSEFVFQLLMDYVEGNVGEIVEFNNIKEVKNIEFSNGVNLFGSSNKCEKFTTSEEFELKVIHGCTKCFDYSYYDDNVCNSHGDCLANDYCECQTGYLGGECKIKESDFNLTNDKEYTLIFYNFTSSISQKCNKDLEFMRICLGGKEKKINETMDIIKEKLKENEQSKTYSFEIYLDLSLFGEVVKYNEIIDISTDNIVFSNEVDLFRSNQNCEQFSTSQKFEMKVIPDCLSCFDHKYYENSVCSSHGECVSENFCSCEEGYFGGNCEFMSNKMKLHQEKEFTIVFYDYEERVEDKCSQEIGRFCLGGDEEVLKTIQNMTRFVDNDTSLEFEMYSGINGENIGYNDISDLNYVVFSDRIDLFTSNDICEQFSTTERFEMKVFSDCTKCFGTSYYEKDVCSSGGKCVGKDNCDCIEENFGGNCGFNKNDVNLGNNREYTLLFYDFSPLISQKCSKEFEFGRYCLGGEEELIFDTISLINDLLRTKHSSDYEFEVYKYLSLFGEVVKYNHMLELNQIQFSNGIDLYKSIGKCEQFNTSKNVEMKVVSGCRKCFGVEYYKHNEVCSKHGNCLSEDFCVCEEGYFGANCEFRINKTNLFQNRKYTLVFYNFTSKIEDKCGRNELFRICLGGSDGLINKTIHEISTRLISLIGENNSTLFKFEIYDTPNGEIVRFNDIFETNYMTFSNGVDLFKSIGNCEKFSTTNAFEMKVLSGCTECFGYDYYEPTTCSSHGNCLGSNYCDCNEGFMGGNCNISETTFDLFENREYTLIFYNYTSSIADKCNKNLEIERFCFGGKQKNVKSVLGSINELVRSLVNSEDFVLEIYSGLSVYGEVFKLNNIQDINNVMFSNEIDLFRSKENCEKFSTTNNFELKIKPGCLSCFDYKYYEDDIVCSGRGDCYSEDFCVCDPGFYGGECEFLTNKTKLYQDNEFTLIFYDYTTKVEDKCSLSKEIKRFCLGKEEIINTLDNITRTLSMVPIYNQSQTGNFKLEIYDSEKGEIIRYNNMDDYNDVVLSNAVNLFLSNGVCEKFTTTQVFEMKVVPDCLSCFDHKFYDKEVCSNGNGTCLFDDYCVCNTGYFGGDCSFNKDDIHLKNNKEYTLIFYNFTSVIEEKCTQDQELFRVCLGSENDRIQTTYDFINEQLKEIHPIGYIFDIYNKGETVKFNNIIQLNDVGFSNEIDLSKSNENCEKFSTSEGFEMKVLSRCTQCFGVSYYKDHVCSGRGECLSDDFCVCEEGYFGGNCEFISNNKTKLFQEREFTLIFYNYSSSFENKCKEELFRYCLGTNAFLNEILNSISTKLSSLTGKGFNESKLEIYEGSNGESESIRLNDISYMNYMTFSNEIVLSKSSGNCEKFTTTNKFEMRVLTGCTECFGTSYYKPEVCSSNGECLSDEFCVCDENFIGGVCSIGINEFTLFDDHKYSLVFYNFSSNIRYKCNKNNEVFRVCLGGREFSINDTLNMVNLFLQDPGYMFQIYGGGLLSDYGEVVKYNKLVGGIEFSNGVDLFKSNENCEKFSTTEKFEMKVVSGCLSCFGVWYYEDSVCSSHGKCSREDFCSCEEGYFGGNCEFILNETKLYQEREYSLVFYNFTYNIENKCKNEIQRFCLGGNGTLKTTLNEINDLVYRVMNSDMNEYEFELYEGTNGEIIQFNNIKEMNNIIYSNGIELIKSNNVCEKFSTTDGFEVKVLHKCMECFGKSYHHREVCSSHGRCIREDYCSCDDGYYGGNCNFYFNETVLQHDREYELIFYNFSSIIESKCNKGLEFKRFCLGGGDNSILNTLNDVNDVLQKRNQRFSIEIYRGISDMGEIIKYNNLLILTDIQFSNGVDLFKSIGNCEQFSTTNNFEMKVMLGCRKCFGKSYYDSKVCSSHGECISEDFCVCQSDYFGGNCEFTINETKLYQNQQFTLVFYKYKSKIEEKCKEEIYRKCLGGNDFINSTISMINDMLNNTFESLVNGHKFMIYKSHTGELVKFNNIKTINDMEFSNPLQFFIGNDNCVQFSTSTEFEMKVIRGCTQCFGYDYYDTNNVCNGKGECLANDYCVCSENNDYHGGGCQIKDSEYSLIDKREYTLVFYNQTPSIVNKCSNKLEFARFCLGGAEKTIMETVDLINEKLEEKETTVGFEFQIYRNLSVFGEVIQYNRVVDLASDNIMFSNQIDLFKSNENCEQFSSTSKFEMKVIPDCLSCFGLKYYENGVCSNHGQCISENFCECENGSFGGKCEFMSNKSKLYQEREFSLVFYEYTPMVENKCSKEIAKFCLGGNENVLDTMNRINKFLNNTEFRFEIYDGQVNGEYVQYNNIEELNNMKFSQSIDLFISNDICEQFSTTQSFEMKILPECTECFGKKYYDPNVCSSNGSCLFDSYCECQSNNFGGNCGFSNSDIYLEEKREYTLIFFNYTSIIDKKCTKNFEFARYCLGGEENSILTTMNMINEKLKVKHPLGHDFTIYSGLSEFGEVIKFNKVFEKNEITFSNEIDLYKSNGKCEQLSTTDRFEIKVVPDCRRCFSIPYYDRRVCSGRGNCLANNYCVCESEYFGANCEFRTNKTRLLQDNEYTLVLYNFTSTIEDKCNKDLEFMRICLGADGLFKTKLDEISGKLLQQIGATDGVFKIEITEEPINGELIQFNNVLNLNYIIFSNTIALSKSIGNCAKFSTTDGFELKVLSGCTECFGYSYYDERVCNYKKGECLGNNHCVCKEGYFGLSCNFTKEEYDLFNNQDYTLVFYNYTSNVNDKCEKNLEFMRICLGGKDLNVYDTIFQINQVLKSKNDQFLFDIYKGSIYGESVLYNNMKDLYDIEFSNEVVLYKSNNNCEQFTTSKNVEIKVLHGCVSCFGVSYYEESVCSSNGQCLGEDFCVCENNFFGGNCEFNNSMVDLYQDKEYTIIFYNYEEKIENKCTNELFKVCLGGYELINNTMNEIREKLLNIVNIDKSEFMFEIYRGSTGEILKFNDIRDINYIQSSNVVELFKSNNNCEKFTTTNAFEMKVRRGCRKCFSHSFYSNETCSSHGNCLENDYCSCEMNYLGGACNIPIAEYNLVDNREYTLIFYNYTTNINEKCNRKLELMRICLGGKQDNVNSTLSIINHFLTDRNHVFEIYRGQSLFGETVKFNNIEKINDIKFSNEIDLFKSNENCEQFSTSDSFEMKVVPGCLSCFGVSYYEESVCSSHGTCLSEDFCSCYEGYFGGNCDYTISNKTKLHQKKEFTLIFFKYSEIVENKCSEEIKRFCIGNEKIFDTITVINDLLNINSTKEYKFEIYDDENGEYVRYNKIDELNNMEFSNDVELFKSNGICEEFSTTNKFEMKVITDCTKCNDISYYSPNVCSSNGSCLGENYCECNDGFFGGNCEFLESDICLKEDREYTLFFYNYSSTVVGKCSKDLEFMRICLGGKEDNIATTIDMINQRLKQHSSVSEGEYQFTLYNGLSLFGESVKYNYILDLNNIEFSNEIELYKSNGNCEQFSTTKEFEFKIIPSCVRCYNVRYYDNTVCSSRGVCLSDNYCKCDEDYFGVNCEFTNNKTKLLEKKEYTLVFYNFTSKVQDKCKDELFRACLGGDKNIKDTINQITTRLNKYINSNNEKEYIFDIHYNEGETGEVVMFNNIADTLNVEFSNDIQLSKSTGNCEQFSTTKGFEMKVIKDCTSCFGVSYYENKTCSSRGICLSQDFCVCNNGYIGGNCEFKENDYALEFDREYTLIFYNYSTVVDQKCSNDLEFLRVCLGGKKISVNSTLSLIDNKLSYKESNEFVFEIYRGYSEFGEIVRYNNIVDEKNIIFSNNIDLYKSKNNCEQFETSSQFEMKVVEGCKSCFGISYFEENVCNNHGGCLINDFCSCSEGYIGGNCKINETRKKFKDETEYTLIFYNFSSVVESKCKEELFRVCLGGSEEITEVIETINHKLNSFVGNDYVFEIYEENEEYKREHIRLNYYPTLNNFKLSNAIELYKIDSYCEQFSTSEEVEIVIKRGCRSCFSYSYYKKDVCSSHGVCIGENNCVCENEYFGGKCEFQSNSTLDTEWTVVFYNFSIINTDKCDDDVEILRICLGKKGVNLNETLTSINNFLRRYYGLIDFEFEIYDSNVVTLNKKLDDTRLEMSNELDFPLIHSYCNRFTTTDKFELKIFQGCYESNFNMKIFSVNEIGFSYMVMYYNAIIVCVIVLFIFALIICCQIFTRRILEKRRPEFYEKALKRENKKIKKLESKKMNINGEDNIPPPKSKWNRFKYLFANFVFSFLFMLVLKAKDLFALLFSLSNFVQYPDSDVVPEFLEQLNLYNGVLGSLFVVVIIYSVVDFIVLFTFINMSMLNTLKFLIAYGAYKEFLLSKYILIYTYTIFAVVGLSYIFRDYWSENFFKFYWISDTGFLSLLLSELLLLAGILSCFNYNGSSSYAYYRQLYNPVLNLFHLIFFRKRLDIDQKLHDNFPSIPFKFNFLKSPDDLLENVFNALQAIHVLKNSTKEILSYEKLIEECKKRSVYSHIEWDLVENFKDNEVEVLIEYLFTSEKCFYRVESYIESLMFQPVLKPKFLKSFFIGFTLKRYFTPSEKEKNKKRLQMTSFTSQDGLLGLEKGGTSHLATRSIDINQEELDYMDMVDNQKINELSSFTSQDGLLDLEKSEEYSHVATQSVELSAQHLELIEDGLGLTVEEVAEELITISQNLVKEYKNIVEIIDNNPNHSQIDYLKNEKSKIYQKLKTVRQKINETLS